MNRLHRDLVALVPGGAPRALSAKKAKALLASIRPHDEVGRLRRRLAAELLADLVGLDSKLARIEAEIKALVRSTPTGLPGLYGVGPVITAIVLARPVTSPASATVTTSPATTARHRMTRAVPATPRIA